MNCYAKVILAAASWLCVSPAQAAGGVWQMDGTCGSSHEEDATATLLPSGNILIAGGQDENGPQWASWVCNPLTGVFVGGHLMHSPHFGHTATLLATGKVLVVGGIATGSMPTAIAELYDPATDSWTNTGSLHKARTSHAATLLENTGKVMVTGGFDANGNLLSSVEIYDPATGAWTTTAPMSCARKNHTADNGGPYVGGVIVTGGYSSCSNGQPDRSIELYDPANAQWHFGPTMHANRAFHTASAVNGVLPGLLIVGGGSQITEVCSFGLPYQCVTTPGQPAVSRFWHAVVQFSSYAVLAIGGADSPTTEIYDPPSGTWRDAGALNIARSRHTATLLPNGQVYVAEGLTPTNDGLSFVSNAELYYPGDIVFADGFE
jgi:hypothetical protein